MHRALTLASSLGMVTKVFFPKATTLGTFLGLPNLKFFNPLVEGNPEQRTAVQAIVSKLSGSAPYVVFGPPGTGKTVTLVEAIKQAWRRYPDAHILATAPSNTAADLLTEHLAEHISKEELLRLHAASRIKEEISPVVAAVSNLTKEGEFTYPALPLLMEYKVVVTTLVTSGRLVSAVVPSTHFNFVFIDEAGQATEPETVIALAGLVAQHTNTKQGAQVVMAGDPWQLGPVVASRLASQSGLDTSLLERLMNLDLYSKGRAGYEGRCITKLVRNFRSHPALLTLPSKLFYSGELLPCADPKIVNSCLSFQGLTEATRGLFPFLFHGVVASDMREGKSPSFFNPSEAVVVLGYIAALIEQGMPPANIGVIAPYKKQVLKIRDRLALKPWGDEVKVGKQFDRIVGEWKSKVDGLGMDLDVAQNETRTISSELFRVKSAYDESILQLEEVRRENKMLSNEIKDIMDQISEGGRSIHEIDKIRKRLEAEKLELEAALSEAEGALEQEENKVLRAQLELTQVRQEIERRIAE